MRKCCKGFGDQGAGGRVQGIRVQAATGSSERRGAVVVPGV
jgi:hypothetical protein